MDQRSLCSRTILFLCGWSLLTLLWSFSLFAAPAEPAPPPQSVPVWIYDAQSYSFWRDPQGHYQGFYPELIRAINEKYGYHLQIRPISGNEISQRFTQDRYGIYADVIRTEERARKKILSARIFTNEVLAASLTRTLSAAEELNQTRVIFRRNDATWDQIHLRYPDLRFRDIQFVATSEEAFNLLRENKADFYINDAGEMEDTLRYYTLSRPFPDLHIAIVMAFSPELHGLRANINQFINDWQRSGKLQKLEDETRRNFLLSRIALSAGEKQWLSNNKLTVWLPKNENFAPLVWKDKQGYHGSVVDMINDIRDLLHVEVDVQYVDNYVAQMREQKWPIRLVNVINTSDYSQSDGMIGPTVAWHNVYYNRIDQPFLWDEEQIRHQRVGVLRGSFAGLYLRQRFGNEIFVVSGSSIEELLDAIENHRIDYILGDLSSLELSLRGNELFRGVLKVAGMTRVDYEIGPWVDPAHPLQHLLAQIHRISSYRTQIERHVEPKAIPELTKNTFRMISLVLLITALFSLCLLAIMWRQMKQNRAVNRSIVEAMEKVNRAHDDETGSHIHRVAQYCGFMARELKLPRRMVHEIEHFASLHDVGKIAVPERILRKQGPLSPEEFNEMKLHTLKGWRIIQGLGLGPVAENIIHFHHEKWDGSGYPEGLRGEQIPIEARILALADVYDALRQKRVYKPGYSHERACEMIFQGAGQHFDPQLVALFRQQHLKFQAIFDAQAD
ncbi:HD domain-containing phosphohydrolase [Superficieibacter sp.]|uniref:HD domain-containing phosphohydrolase n=1 Tax=Superficieibacter sp. TaxID=2303322 RepID=UPI0028AD51EF|nr:HD domain-containing phosphohydrolase [Superficieibacter sp.]